MLPLPLPLWFVSKSADSLADDVLGGRRLNEAIQGWIVKPLQSFDVGRGPHDGFDGRVLAQDQLDERLAFDRSADAYFCNVTPIHPATTSS
jgi:hypothetical protein